MTQRFTTRNNEFVWPWKYKFKKSKKVIFGSQKIVLYTTCSFMFSLYQLSIYKSISLFSLPLSTYLFIYLYLCLPLSLSLSLTLSLSHSLSGCLCLHLSVPGAHFSRSLPIVRAPFEQYFTPNSQDPPKSRPTSIPTLAKPTTILLDKRQKNKNQFRPLSAENMVWKKFIEIGR